MTIEQALDELNDSDVMSSFHDLAGSVECLETVETLDDFQANIESALDEASALIEGLRELQSSVGKRAKP